MDYNKIAILEHQIAQKYGQDATKHPRADWTPEDEIEYDKQADQLYKKFSEFWGKKRYTKKCGYLVAKKLLNGEETEANCICCDKYKILFNARDDISYNKYECCYGCYTKYIEGREERWNEGWRPEKDS